MQVRARCNPLPNDRYRFEKSKKYVSSLSREQLTLMDCGQICAKIPNFWLNAILNHHELSNYIASEDYECLGTLTALDVQVDAETKIILGPRMALCIMF